MGRVASWFIGWLVFLGLAVMSLVFLVQLAPREGVEGQFIDGSGTLTLLIWCPGLLVFSAIAALIARALRGPTDPLEKDKRKAPPKRG